jgi:hypothetical protein
MMDGLIKGRDVIVSLERGHHNIASLGSDEDPKKVGRCR